MVPATRTPGQDKRKHPRLTVNLPAVYRSANMTMDAYVANLSQGGAFVAAPSVDAVGTPAHLTISLPGQAEPIRVEGRVIWVHRLHPRRGMGICFTALGREQRLALANFLIARCYPG